jgi:hypothetical protein
MRRRFAMSKGQIIVMCIFSTCFWLLSFYSIHMSIKVHEMRPQKADLVLYEGQIVGLRCERYPGSIIDSVYIAIEDNDGEIRRLSMFSKQVGCRWITAEYQNLIGLHTRALVEELRKSNYVWNLELYDSKDYGSSLLLMSYEKEMEYFYKMAWVRNTFLIGMSLFFTILFVLGIVYKEKLKDWSAKLRFWQSGRFR